MWKQPKTVPKKTSYVAKSLTGVVVSPNAYTIRSECGPVEVAYDVEGVGPMSRLLEVKQQYITPTLSVKALYNNKYEFGDNILSSCLSTTPTTFFS